MSVNEANNEEKKLITEQSLKDPGFLTQFVIIRISNALRMPECLVVGSLGGSSWGCQVGVVWKRKTFRR